jgi:DNA-binding transcriptional ArsR family regulator
MIELDVIDRPEAAVVALDPVRARILAELAEPGSASSVAATLGLPRQQVNYHLRTLEQHGLVELVEERPRRGLTERVMRATARSYVIAPPGLGRDGAMPERTDRLSSSYLVALAARAVREVGELARRADRSGRPLATLADRAAFTQELVETVTHLAGKYHDEHGPSGRWHCLIVAAHPRPSR